MTERGFDTKSGGEQIASYGSYEEAQRAVDHLSDEGFPVERLSIVGEDLKIVEQVTGRKGYGQAAAQGAGSGALVGAFFGFIFGLFGLIDPLISAFVLAVLGLVFGAVVGALAGLISHALSGGRRDFSSVGGMRASRYSVVADGEVAERARMMLTDLAGNPQERAS